MPRFLVFSSLLLVACGPDATGGGPVGGGDGLLDSAPSDGLVDTSSPDGAVQDAIPADTTTTPEATPAETSDAQDTAPGDTAIDTADTRPDTADTLPDGTEFGALTGTVWAPGNAPGMVPAGQQIPVHGAVVYLAAERPSPIPQQAYCEGCGAAPPRSVHTDVRGNFALTDRVVGTWWLVIQKGQFRLETQVTVAANQTLALSAAQTTLPSVHDPESGRWIPRIAIATGSFDHLEDIFGKLGMGAVDALGGYETDGNVVNVDLWENGGWSYDGMVGTLEQLVRDPQKLARYHIIFIPCSGDDNILALRDPVVLNNIREYVRHGGNLYVTDWSGEWSDNVFPAAVQLGPLVDTPAAAYDFATNSWNTFLFSSADGDAYDSEHAEAVDRGLHDWLDGQVGPTAESETPSTFDADDFYVEGNWNTIEATPSYQVAVGPNGAPVMDQARVYVEGTVDDFFAGTTVKPLTVTFEPAGCGRVLFSTYHTTDFVHVGLAPQERVLLYLIMEIGTCRFTKG